MDYNFLSTTNFFNGTQPDEIQAMMGCMGAVEKNYDKDEVIFHVGDVTRALGLVLSGSVIIDSIDIWGRKNILAKITPGNIFAEPYACLQDEKLMVSITAAEKNTSVVLLNVGKIITMCPNACKHHSRVIENLLAESARKSLSLQRKILHVSSKTIRGRLVSFLSYQAVQCGGRSFTINYDRQQLADYLNVERSALSNELSKMQQDGILEVKRNHFTLIGQEWSSDIDK